MRLVVHGISFAAIVMCLMVAPNTGAQTPAAVTPSQDTVEEITVLGLRDKIINDFVRSYARPVPSGLHQLARWKSAVCPRTYGLVSFQRELINRRIRSAAESVGAGPTPKDGCKPNVWVYFETGPQKTMDRVRKEGPWLLGFHYASQAKELATVRHTVQAWYATQTEDLLGKARNDDGGLTHSSSCTSIQTAGPLPCFQDSGAEFNNSSGSLLGSGGRSLFSTVLIVIDANKIKGVPIAAIADYVAMLALAQTDKFDECRVLPSISNLFAADCAADRKSQVLTNIDLAYLRGLYQMNPRVGPHAQNSGLVFQMKKNLSAPAP